MVSQYIYMWRFVARSPSSPHCVVLLGAVAVAGALLVGCGDQDKAHETFIPASGTVEQFQRYCSVCHMDARTGAPLAGDRSVWQERMAKGMPTLMKSTIEGMGDMPPLGLCFECSGDEFEALINYMSNGEFEP